MILSATDRFTTEKAIEIYGLDGWGNGYLSIDAAGHLRVAPGKRGAHGIDVYDVVERLREQGVGAPLLLRFPQLLQGQVEELAGAFDHAIREFDYAGGYRPVFPVKVNQSRAVVEPLLEAGRRFGLGLEVGSRPELLTATALPLAPQGLILCNGFKDASYLAAASLATRLGRRVVVVVEKPFELDGILELAASGLAVPMLGFRIRLQARGSGLWEKSGGSASKFGLSTLQLLRALERLHAAGLGDRVALLHFHIGSQVTEIRKIKNAVLEASRIYAKLRGMGVEIGYLDVGGGLGIDYDGSRTSSDASVNYTVQEYANDVVFGIKEICEQEAVPLPTIVSESGRMLASYHAILVSDVRARVAGFAGEPLQVRPEDPQVVQDLAEVDRNISVKNYREFYHDAILYRDQMYSAFNLGMIGLEDRAKAENLFWSIARKAVRHSKSAKFVADEFVELAARLHEKYICNFSLFQSLPDHWALDQLFPAMPIHRLDEPPTVRATLADITCDSDGEVEKFVDLKDIKEALEVHELRDGEPYYLGFLLIGAYQGTMGDLHNLFGRVHEAQVTVDADGATHVSEVRLGDAARDTIECFGYESASLLASVERGLTQQVDGGDIARVDADELLAEYERSLSRYTYLE
jgi:arginine decarboxylase